MEDWKVVTVDEAEMLEKTQEAAENVWLRYYPNIEGSNLFL